MINLKEIIEVHSLLIKKYGGLDGIRDLNLLISSINRPFQTFDGADLYDTPIKKASALFESLIINHPFYDGNKRIAYVAMMNFLFYYSIDIKASQDEKYEFVIAAASGKKRFDDIEKWLIEKCIFL